eukprot:SAG22_NODE_304_length_12712_cov_10.515421_4_plen_348_part_00
MAVGGVEHETTQLLATVGLKTEWSDFDDLAAVAAGSVNGTLKRGADGGFADVGGSNTIADGFVDGCGAQGLEVVPLCWAKARTGGPVDKATLERLVAEVLTPLKAALHDDSGGVVDGVLLSLHGAFCAEQGYISGVDVPLGSRTTLQWREDDADGAILAAVRELIGPGVPLFSVHDLHCNISQKMVDAADLLVVERTFPHVDMHERAIHACELMARTLRNEVRPAMAWRSIPTFWSATRMLETAEPFKSLVERLELLAPSDATSTFPSAAQNLGYSPRGTGSNTGTGTGTEILSASVGVGYQWADSPTMGAAVIVCTNGDLPAAQVGSVRTDDWMPWIDSWYWLTDH